MIDRPPNPEHLNHHAQHFPLLIGLANHVRESVQTTTFREVAKQIIIGGVGGLVVLYAGVEVIKSDLRWIKEQMIIERELNKGRFDHMDRAIASNKAELIDVDKELAKRILECERKR